MSDPVSAPASVQASAAADLVQRAAPPSSPVAQGGFEAVISDRGVDLTDVGTRPTKAAPEPAAAAPAAVVTDSTPAPPVQPAATATVASGDGSASDLAATYNARGRLAVIASEAPQSRLLDITG